MNGDDTSMDLHLEPRYRALAAAVIAGAVDDATQPCSALHREPPCVRPGVKLNDAITECRRVLAAIRRRRDAHRFLTSDDSLWWEIARIDRARVQAQWSLSHRVEIASMESLEIFYRQLLSRLKSDSDAAKRERALSA